VSESEPRRQAREFGAQRRIPEGEFTSPEVYKIRVPAKSGILRE